MNHQKFLEILSQEVFSLSKYFKYISIDVNKKKPMKSSNIVRKLWIKRNFSTHFVIMEDTGSFFQYQVKMMTLFLMTWVKSNQEKKAMKSSGWNYESTEISRNLVTGSFFALSKLNIFSTFLVTSYENKKIMKIVFSLEWFPDEIFNNQKTKLFLT